MRMHIRILWASGRARFLRLALRRGPVDREQFLRRHPLPHDAPAAVCTRIQIVGHEPPGRVRRTDDTHQTLARAVIENSAHFPAPSPMASILTPLSAIHR